ncbi:hypothetical protein KUCAC02_030045 [Chaenocephalus aceratus]|uniref:Uncharacterized protein n=1 Tax=Chaenocephalus aceratus TaxID=36190 RepID=A0ACB9XIV9_CHAAC|nr:hypothetical protein KUCAC02_030045 [Chaenocephalus aceratus]
MKCVQVGNMSNGRFSHLLRGVWLLWQGCCAELIIQTRPPTWRLCILAIMAAAPVSDLKLSQEQEPEFANRSGTGSRVRWANPKENPGPGDRYDMLGSKPEKKEGGLGCVLWLELGVSSGRFPQPPSLPPPTSVRACRTVSTRHLQDRVSITADIPPRLDGTWVSTRCEVRPGPEFITRSYNFHPSRHFTALQHYIQTPTPELPPGITRGGTEAEHHLSKVGIVVHSLAAKQRLSSRLPSSCVGLTLSRVMPGSCTSCTNTRAGRGVSVGAGLLYDGGGADTCGDAAPQPWREDPGAVLRRYSH